jgi:hypothetical protein
MKHFLENVKNKEIKRLRIRGKSNPSILEFSLEANQRQKLGRMLLGGNARTFNIVQGSRFYSYLTFLFLFLITVCFAKPSLKNYQCFTLYKCPMFL